MQCQACTETRSSPQGRAPEEWLMRSYDRPASGNVPVSSLRARLQSGAPRRGGGQFRGRDKNSLNFGDDLHAILFSAKKSAFLFAWSPLFDFKWSSARQAARQES